MNAKIIALSALIIGNTMQGMSLSYSSARQRPLVSTIGAAALGVSAVTLGGLVFWYKKTGRDTTRLVDANKLYTSAHALHALLETKYGALTHLTENDLIAALLQSGDITQLSAQLFTDVKRLGSVITELATAQRAWPTTPHYSTLSRDVLTLIDTLRKTHVNLVALMAQVKEFLPYIDLHQYMVGANTDTYKDEGTALYHSASPEQYRATMNAIIIRKATKKDARNFYPYIEYAAALEAQLASVRCKLLDYTGSTQYGKNPALDLVAAARNHESFLQRLHEFATNAAEYSQDMERKQRALQQQQKISLKQMVLNAQAKQAEQQKVENDLRARELRYNRAVAMLCRDAEGQLSQYPTAAVVVPGFGNFIGNMRTTLQKIRETVG
jgi:hypothetical protein